MDLVFYLCLNQFWFPRSIVHLLVHRMRLLNYRAHGILLTGNLYVFFDMAFIFF